MQWLKIWFGRNRIVDLEFHDGFMFFIFENGKSTIVTEKEREQYCDAVGLAAAKDSTSFWDDIKVGAFTIEDARR